MRLCIHKLPAISVELLAYGVQVSYNPDVAEVMCHHADVAELMYHHADVAEVMCHNTDVSYILLMLLNCFCQIFN